jgi:hypothetical protein
MRVISPIDGPMPAHVRVKGRPTSWWLENPNAERVRDELSAACVAGIEGGGEPFDEPMAYDYGDPEKWLRRWIVTVQAICRVMPGARDALLAELLGDRWTGI